MRVMDSSPEIEFDGSSRGSSSAAEKSHDTKAAWDLNSHTLKGPHAGGGGKGGADGGGGEGDADGGGGVGSADGGGGEGDADGGGGVGSADGGGGEGDAEGGGVGKADGGGVGDGVGDGSTGVDEKPMTAGSAFDLSRLLLRCPTNSPHLRDTQKAAVARKNKTRYSAVRQNIWGVPSSHPSLGLDVLFLSCFPKFSSPSAVLPPPSALGNVRRERERCLEANQKSSFFFFCMHMHM